MSAQVLRDFGLEPSTSELMSRLGLPSRLPGDVPVVQFEVPRVVEINGTRLLAFGREPWGEDLLLCLSVSGEVLAAGDGGRQIVNGRLSSFLGLLEAYEAFQAQAQAKAEDSGPVRRHFVVAAQSGRHESVLPSGPTSHMGVRVLFSIIL